MFLALAVMGEAIEQRGRHLGSSTTRAFKAEEGQLNAVARALALVQTECRSGHGVGCDQHGHECGAGGHGSRHPIRHGAGRRHR
jgi:hypothetical protein